MGPFTVRHSGNVRAARSQVWSFRVFVNDRGFEIRRYALMVFDEEKESFRWSTCPGTRRHTLRLFPADSAVLPLLLLFCKHSSHLVVFPAPCTHQSAVRSTDCKLCHANDSSVFGSFASVLPLSKEFSFFKFFFPTVQDS